MKTIAIDIRPLLAGVGGVPEYTRQIITRITQNHPEYTYVFFCNSFRALRDEQFFFPPHSQRAYFRCPSKLLNTSLFISGLPRLDTIIQRRIGKRVDLFFAPNIDFFSFSRDIPSVVTVHDATFRMYPECFTKKQRLWHRMVRPQRIFQNATQCIAVSEHTKRDIISMYGIDEQKIHVIPLGVDQMFFQKTGPQKILRGIPNAYILAFGARDRRKNAAHVIRAYGEAKKQEKRMAQWKLVILGGHTALGELHAEVERQGIADSVVFLASVSSDERHALFSRARVCVYASVYEGFGLPPVEAMACGTPVISAAHSSLSEVCGNAAYMADPHHTQSVSRALIACALDEQVRAYYKEKGIKRAQTFSWDAAAERTVRLFSSLLS